MEKPLASKEVLLGVTGGIAAYKSCELVRGLRELGAGVTVVMTDAAARFVTPLTFSALSGRPVHSGLFDVSSGKISHIEVTARADVFVVAPATANIIGKMAAGVCDDLLSTMLMAAKCPVLLAPAMNCRMYENPALRRNLDTLKGFGINFVGPEKGPMACDEYGWGRMSEPGEIINAVVSLRKKGTRRVDPPGELKGKKILVSAGPTIEDIDPVRFIGNRSTGRMGYAVAREAVARGADVTLVTGPSEIEPPAGLETIKVRSAAEMRGAVRDRAKASDIVIMAAAVADYTPESVAGRKIKKGAEAMTLRLVKTPDILGELGAHKRAGQILVGFAAETEDIEKNAIGKLREKNLDMIAANSVGDGRGFGSIYNEVKLYGQKGLIADTGVVTKDEAARTLIDAVVNAISKPKQK
jgi:phosphopantothenoylcysteine decarboxylase/phosphopantothenate--cysteine ligase